MMGSLSFDQSGKGEAAAPGIDIAAVQALCVDLGFVKPGADSSKTLAQRADTVLFFKHMEVTSVSSFKTKFWSTAMRAPSPHDAPPAKKPSGSRPGAPGNGTGNGHQAGAKPEPAPADQGPIPDISQYEQLSKSSWEGLKWRLIPRPGGAIMKPADYYELYAAQMQAEQGDNKAEKPMWAEHGGLDFDGRERWEAYSRCAGMSKEDAQKRFCAMWARAMAPSRSADNFRKH